MRGWLTKHTSQMHGGYNMNKENEKKIYIRPEDTLELILEKIDGKWKSVEEIEENIQRMLGYFKAEKFDKLQNEFGF